MNSRYAWLWWSVVLILAIGPRLFDLDIFYARDELTNWSWSDDFSQAVWALDPGATFTGSNHPGIPLFWAQTLFFTAKYVISAPYQSLTSPAELLSSDRSLPFLAERRLIVALVVSAQIVVAVWLVQRLLGWRVALVTAVLLGLDPFSLSEARVLRFEMASALFACLSVLTFFVYWQHRSWSWLLWSGIIAGLAVSTKASAGLLVPFIWLLLLLDFLFEPALSVGDHIAKNRVWLKRFQQLLGNGLIWAAGAIGTYWLIWPAMWVRPFEALQYIFIRGLSQVSQNSVWHGPVFFWGHIFPDGNPGPFFYPVVFAFRTTPLIWVGGLSALLFVGLLLWRITAKRSPLSLAAFGSAGQQISLAGLPWPAVATILLLVYVILITSELTTSISKVDRYLVLVLPALDILSAIGLAVLIHWLVRSTADFLTIRSGHSVSRKPPLTDNRLWVGALAAILGLQLFITLPAHPYYYTYWNPWAGGGQAAMRTLTIGSGEGVDLAMDYLNSLPGATEATLVCGGSQPWCSGKFKGHTVRSATYFDGQWVQADYASFYISHLQRQNYPSEVVDFFMQQEPSYAVELQGATYMWVYAVPEITHFAGPRNDLVGLGRLLGYNLEPPIRSGESSSQRSPGQELETTVWWTNLGAGVDNLVLRLVDDTGYEWARAGLVPQPDYAAILPGQRAIVVSTATLAVPPGTPPGLYFLRLGVLDPDQQRLLGEFTMPDEASRLVVVPGQIFTEPAQFSISRPIDQLMAPQVSLLGYTPPDQVLTPDSPAWLVLYWQAQAPPADYLVRLRLLDEAGAELAGWQGRPGYGRYPTQNWRTGEIVKDVWALQAPADVPVGRYQLELTLLDSHESPLQPPLDLGQIEVWPQPISYAAPSMQAAVQANFGEKLTLLGYDLFFDIDNAHSGKLVPVFFWQSQTDLTAAFDLALTLRANQSDQVVKEWRLPLGGEIAKEVWKAGEVVNTIYQLEVGAVTGQGYHLDIALVSRSNGQMVPVTLADKSGRNFLRIEDIQDKIVVRTTGE